MSGQSCSNCTPSSSDHCSNQGNPKTVSDSFKLDDDDGSVQPDKTGSQSSNMCGINEQSLDQSCVSHGPVQSNVNDRLFRAYGACFLGLDGGEQINEWGQRWKRVVSIRGQQYDLPGGSVGREFVNLLTNEVSMLSRGEAISERLFVFCGVVLQRDSMVKKGTDIRRLLKRRMDSWKQNRFDELVYE